MKIDRLLSIMIILLEHKRVSSTTLTEMFEVTPRTIYRDIETINLSGIPIVAYPGVNGGFSIMEEYKIRKKLFTISDISALLVGLGIYSTLSNEEILNTIAKVKGLIPAEQIKDMESKSKQIAIDPPPLFGSKNLNLNIEKIRSAINENKYIYFKYFNRIGKKSQRKIVPYKLVLKNSNWYIQGYCMTRDDFRTFEISHISSLKILKETFIPREIDYEYQDVSFSTDKKIITIKLLIDESLRDLMIEFCGKEKIEPFENNKLIAYFPFVEDDYWYSILLRFGDKCECLEPENIRLEFIRRIENLLNTYKKREKQTLKSNNI